LISLIFERTNMVFSNSGAPLSTVGRARLTCETCQAERCGEGQGVRSDRKLKFIPANYLLIPANIAIF